MESSRTSMAHTDNHTYTSTELRARDRRIFGQYDKRDAERKRQHAFAQDRNNISLFELNNKAQRLAVLLGYTDLHEAIVEIETADVGISFRECLHRLQTTERKLEVEKMDSEVLKLKLEKAEKAQLAMHEEVRELKHSCRKLKVEKKDIETRYDNLLDVRLRAEDRYKTDYKKWKAIYRWLRSDGPDEDHPEVSEDIKKALSKQYPSIAKKRQLIVDGVVDISFMENHLYEFSTPTSTPKSDRIQTGSSTRKRTNKENVRSSLSPSKKRPSTSPRKKPRSARRRGSLTPSSNKLLLPALDTGSSPFPSNHSPLRDVQPKLTTRFSSRSPTKLPNTRNQSPRSSQHVSNSSDTEPDTQSIWIPMKRRLEPQSIFKTPVPPVASSSNTPGTNESSRTLVDDPTPVPKRAKLGMADPIRQMRVSPKKGPRVGDADVFTLSKVTKKDDMLFNGEDGDDIEDRYSIFKGHGRYGKAKEVDPTDTTINSEFTINPSNNCGVDYQYDVVVRDRNARKKMHADDCECCKEYYEGVGPIPDRLQPPLWRSPTSSPRKGRQVGIESHKKAISRHRHNWARAPTPPGYWDIGFPNTQEVSAINAKASEMHRKKKEEVSKEAARGGRYKKRTR